MNKIDRNNYKFRNHQLGKLMVNPRRKSEQLSQTTKSFLAEIYIKEVFGRERYITSKFIEKGLYAEEDSISLFTKVEKKLFVKNEKRLKNDYITGIPDIIHGRYVYDIKTKWDMLGFVLEDGKNKDYFWQLQGYMALTGKKKAKLVYTLVNAPEHLIVSEKNRRIYQEGINIDDHKAVAILEDDVEKNMMFDDVPEELRIKVFDFEFDEEKYKQLIERIQQAREFLASLRGLSI